jgi:hypothetical protein
VIIHKERGRNQRNHRNHHKNHPPRGEMRVLMEEIYLMGEVEIITHHNHH